MRKSSTIQTADQQITAIVAIYMPWIRVHPGRIACVGTLSDGTGWNARMPFEAAIAVEAAGYDIRIVGNLDDVQQ